MSTENKKESEILTYLKGGTPYIWIYTREGMQVQKDIIAKIQSEMKKDSGYNIFSWDSERGVLAHSEKKFEKINPKGSDFRSEDPPAAIQIAKDMPDRSIMFVHNMHQYIRDMLLMQMMLNAINELKAHARHVIFLCPSDEIPIEVRDYVTLVKYALPDESKISQIIEIQLSQVERKYPEGGAKIRAEYEKQKEHIINSARGLTVYSVEQAISQSLVLNKRITADMIFEEKRQMVAKASALEFVSPKINFKDVGGMDKLKKFISMEIANPYEFPRPKGALLLGVPGCGKSLIIKAAGVEANLPVLSFDFAKVFRGIVGESESVMAQVVATIDAVAPCIVIVDEIEKGLSGVASSAKTDGGVGDKVGSIWLKWMSDHESPAIVFGSCNSVDKLPAEYLRAGRWDAIYFVDLPNKAEREEILKIHAAKYDVKVGKNIKDLRGYTGAEIEQICITSRRFKIPINEAFEYVVPISKSMQDGIEELRKWAKNKVLMASTPDEEIEEFNSYHTEGRAVEFLEEE